MSAEGIDLTEAMEAAADVVRRNVYVRPHETVVDAAVVPQILTAALPHIERQVREQVAREVEARMSADDHGTESGVAWVGGWRTAIRIAARIARGERA